MHHAAPTPHRSGLRRLALTGALAAVVVAAMPASAQSPAASEAPAASTAAGQSGAFPVTIEHKYGSTTITEVPERVVTIGLTDQDAFIALGHPPVGVTEWFGEQPYGAWPWAAPLLDGAQPVVLPPTGVDFEAVKDLDPDLIVALYGGLTQEEYDTLTQIGPVVAQPGDTIDWGIPWQQQTMVVGQILGKTDEAAALVAAVEAKFGQVQAEHPEFTGKTAVVATPWEGVFVYGPADVRGQLLTRLGFQLPENLAELTGAEFGGDLSEENVDMLDVDVIVWLDGANVPDLGGPLYASMPVHTEGREVFLDSYGSALGGATSFVTVLSLPYLLDGLPPLLATALDGDPATVVPTPAPAATPEASPAS